MMDFEIKRGGTPPPSTRGGRPGKYREIADAARDTPGEWISVAGVNTNVSGSINRSQAAGFQTSGHGDWFEATNRDTQDDGTCTLWVVYHTDGKGADA
jgi:hypothetical protein